jgi:predicted neuraminidase
MDIQIITQHKIFKEEAFFPQCHASTLVRMKNDALVCAWFGGTHEKHDDVAIWYSVCKDGQWTDPKIACDTPNIPCWNPVLFSPDQEQILLYFKSGKNTKVWKTYISSYDAEKDTWGPIKELVEGDIGGRGPVKNKPIRLSDGKVIAPASIETADAWDAYVDISYDDGYTYKDFFKVPLDRSKLHGKGVIQPTLWESSPGRVHMLLRSSEGFIYRSDSSDYGMTWCEAYPIDIPNNNSGIDLTRLEDGTLLLLCNPVGKNWGKRTPLSLFSSCDNGFTWTEEVVIEHDEVNENPEFSYPAIISCENQVYASYTWNRKSVAFVRLTVQKSSGS